MVEEVDDRVSDALAAVSVVHLNELDRKCGGSTRLAQEITDAHHITVRIRVDGDFPGGTVVLRHQFVLDGDAIRRLAIVT